MAFTGLFHGTCNNCEGETKGTEVEYDDRRLLVHVVCPRHGEVCPGCHMELPVVGECENCS